MGEMNHDPPARQCIVEGADRRLPVPPLVATSHVDIASALTLCPGLTLRAFRASLEVFTGSASPARAEAIAAARCRRYSAPALPACRSPATNKHL